MRFCVVLLFSPALRRRAAVSSPVLRSPRGAPAPPDSDNRVTRAKVGHSTFAPLLSWVSFVTLVTHKKVKREKAMARHRLLLATYRRPHCREAARESCGGKKDGSQDAAGGSECGLCPMVRRGKPVPRRAAGVAPGGPSLCNRRVRRCEAVADTNATPRQHRGRRPQPPKGLESH